MVGCGRVIAVILIGKQVENQWTKNSVAVADGSNRVAVVK
jgi:hypothetical protein